MADQFFDRSAQVGSDEEEEEVYDEETGEVRTLGKSKSKSNGDLDDSSEEEDDDDEEAMEAVREGFIVDEDDEDDDTKRERRRERKKRRRQEREDDEVLDEEDLDLIGVLDQEQRAPKESKFKRLKRGHRAEPAETRGVEDIFSEDEDGEGAAAPRRGGIGQFDDEMDGFIEEDEFPDEEGEGAEEDQGVRAPRRAGIPDMKNLKDSGLGEAEMEDMQGAFGDGDEYIWALEAEAAQNEDQLDPDKPLELKDVFEPSQLEERMLTERDHQIRLEDTPERFQLARGAYRDLSEYTDEQLAVRAAEEATWITSILFPRKRMDQDLREPFQAAVRQVLSFMDVDRLEPPFIFQNRKDYLIHSERVPNDDPNGPEFTIKAEKLLNQTDLWDVFEQDLKYRAFSERRDAIQKNVELLRELDETFNDAVFEDMIPKAAQLDDLQDIQDYLNFWYATTFRDLSIAEAANNGTQKRARGNRSMWDKIRKGPPYHVTRAIGITSDAVARNAQGLGARTYVEDPDKLPEDLADTLIRDPDLRTGEEVLNAAKGIFVEELVNSPRLRSHMRKIYYENLVFDCYRTEKGMKAIHEDHPYYEFKYLRNQEVRYFLVDKPELFLRMLKAESEGLVDVKVELRGKGRIKEELMKAIESDNFSEIAEAWNSLRRQVLDKALQRLHVIISKGVKDNLKNECENKIAGFCRDAYIQKLDQAPFKPKGMELGTCARVLALSNGAGQRNDAICWAYVDESGLVKENGKFADLRLGNSEKYIPDGRDVEVFKELVERRKPDVVAVSGWSVETRRLYKDLQDIIEKFELRGTPYEDDDEREVTDPLEVIIPQDEVARLYYNSPRAAVDHPALPPLTRYCVALAHYMQNPLKQYAALRKDIISITFDPNQQLLPEDKLRRYLDTAIVDIVNLVGVDINEAMSDAYTQNLLPYVCGLGQRKAEYMVKTIGQNGGEVTKREDLVGDLDRMRSSCGPQIWTNCASFLYVEWEDEREADYLDGTRIHPSDYEIARKMAADALEMDEEDVAAEINENGGESAVVRKLVRDQATDKVNDLVLEQYAEQLETQFGQKKRATLETIRAELQNPYEELRRNFAPLSTEELFTQLTGETKDSLKEGMIVPVSVKKTFPEHIEVKLDCGIDGGIGSLEFPEDMTANGVEPRNVWTQHQIIQAKLQFIDRRKLTAQLSLRESALKEPYRPNFDHGMDEWDEQQEDRDKAQMRKTLESKSGRKQRVIKHTLFRNFDSAQAVGALQDAPRGECIIRPSSKGPDHLAVTWKIAKGVFQHIDVLELDKENEFSVGRTLKVAGKYTYTDLDELVVNHVQAMAKKVDEMTNDEKYQNGTKQATEQWLSTYTEANPKRSMYAFCINPQYPGYFYCCFKAGQHAPHGHWPVKVIPNGFELKGQRYPDMRALKNGFKILFSQQGPQANGRR
ncbi:hypothetical protein DOTSEDRAFT_70645 [Dothistroma septosporum NZE10]|uniref:Transcription elongation factor Spt6 n=1 Tax=Dothistroma septosporum (strain NZE10 / CBS 128990) TaxID=675120 RepID=N1PTB4_DOTSN|nr:hypothetical protein DOTSEDRAFT_70645 [Dothistroma septosporum NZE10]